MADTRDLLVVLGNQLFAPEHLPGPSDCRVFMAEDMGLCTYERHHQQKIVLFLAAMRGYAVELRDAGYEVEYRELNLQSSDSYEDNLESFCLSIEATTLVHFEIEDKPMEARIRAFAKRGELDRRELPSPMFSCSRDEFAAFVDANPRLLMGEFYKEQRRRLDILVDSDGEPQGGRWSFDADNRKKLPRDVEPPSPGWVEPNRDVSKVIELVEDTFPDHPGKAADFAWPTTRSEARTWLDEFVATRLADFGPFEDALTTRSTTVFHSLLTPSMNIGLLTPNDVIEAVLAQCDDAPLQSIEGFVRQVIGWREFIRGIYRHFSDEQEQRNHWDHERELTDSWYEGTTGIPPLDDAIMTAQKHGWAHHIPRLMVLGNMMTLAEIRPTSAHRWFMEMFIDSSEWVMGPNVYGMGLFSDGGIFATKPYICGSNYLLKMSDYRKGDWCDVVDGLYWRFIDKHRDFFAGNPRLALMPKALDRLATDRKKRIFAAAQQFLDEHTKK